jgi:hypothetical protein
MKHYFHDMNKRLFFSFALATMGITAIALPITPERALQRMEGETATRGGGFRASDMTLAYTMEAQDGVPSVYVFNQRLNSGFVFLSADSEAYPVLGYVDGGAFDRENIAPALKWWLGEYSRQIEFARQNTSASDDISATRASVSGVAIAPMVTTKWNQGTPYNDQCPRINGVRCVTGCVATAMAQVMNYHKYPERGKGTVSIDLEATTDPTKLDLSAETFDWNNMLDSYDGEYTEVQANAVAYLMKACGYSVDMNYSTTVSGAASYYIGKALIDNFGYNPGISFEERVYYNETSWNQMVYDELNAGRPVIYGGQGEGGGHQFVCDGYDGNGYFHINWGWGGASDGYFLLQSLNPDDLGIGGGTGGGFSFDQSIIKGVQPDRQGMSPLKIVQSGNLAGKKNSNANIEIEVEGDNAGWWNMGYSLAYVSFGVIIEGIEGTNVQKTPVVGTINNQSLEEVSLSSLRGFTHFNFAFPSTMPDGKYRVTVAFKDLYLFDGDWTPVTSPECFSNSATVTKAGNRYTIEFAAPKTLSVLSGTIESPLYYGSFAKVKMEVKNDTDVELSQTIAPVLRKQGETQFIGGGVAVNLMPGESVVKEFVTYFKPFDGVGSISRPTSFTLRFVNSENMELYNSAQSEVEMNPEVSTTVSVGDLIVKDATPVGGWKVPAFTVSDPSKIDISARVSCSMGFYSRPIYAILFPNKPGENYSISRTPLTPVLFLSQGETGTVSGTVYFDQAVEGESYVIELYDEENGRFESLDSVCLILIPSSGVDEINGEDGLGVYFDHASGEVKVVSDAGISSIRVVSMSGAVEELPIAAGGAAASASLSHLPKGIYVVTATDVEGRSQSIKIAK